MIRMGRGSRSRESGVKKELEALPRKTSTQSGNQKESKADLCLFSFRSKINLNSNQSTGIVNGSPVTIVPNHTQANQLDLFIENSNLSYKGPHAGKIFKCLSKNYVYEGFVEKTKKVTGGVEVTYFIEGRGR